MSPVARGLACRVLAGLLGVALLTPQLARADEHPDARTASLEANPYHLDPAGRGTPSLGGTELLRHMEVNAALTVQHLHAPLRLIDSADGTELRRLVEQRQQLDVGVGVGILGRFEAGVLLPVIAHQLANLPGQKLERPPYSGLGDLILQGRTRLLSEETSPVGLALTLPLSVPTGNSDAYMGTGGLGFAPRLAVGRHLGDFLFLAGVGYHLQSRTELLNIVSDDRLTYGAGVHFEPPDRSWSVDLEYSGATLVSGPWADSDEVYGEVVVGGSYDLGWGTRVTGGLGRAQAPGVPSPSLRVYVGLSYERELRPDTDGDGLTDGQDRCPTEAEDADGFEDADGCPDPDNDRDGVLDAWDCCPTEIEDPDDFLDMDGCPDPDNDGDGLLDGADLCPDDPEDMDGDADEDGCPDEDPEPDEDGDGIPDAADDCPELAEDMDGDADADGCPDPMPITDGDGDEVADAVDRCPAEAEDPDGFEDTDGCPDPDNDGDGVLDAADGCPEQAEDVDGHQDADGCPEPDNDGDGVPDATDGCPNEPEDGKGEGDALTDGCPLEELAVLTEQEIVIRDQIHFATGNARLHESSVATLRKVLELLHDHPWVRLRIEGHTDANGTEEFNLWLSRARARRVRAWLIANTRDHAAMAARLESEGFGEGQPLADNDSEEGRAKNRRVIFRISNQGGGS